MNEKKLKHLEFIQNVITRMNSNSFLIKGWAVTIASAIYALAAKEANEHYIGVTFLAAIIFWGLDGYYLSQERQYRSLYSEISKKVEDDITFSMNASSYNNGRNTWERCLFSKTVWPVYIVVIAISLLVMFVFNK